jgi:hypothetical protein
MGRTVLAFALAVIIGACGSTGGGAAPSGATTTDAPRATQTPAQTVGPSGSPYVDNYGY